MNFATLLVVCWTLLDLQLLWVWLFIIYRLFFRHWLDFVPLSPLKPRFDG
jgi:hypothetical protein